MAAGFFFGRTSLIKLSPKKTWEGFLGAFASTMLFGFVVSSTAACWPPIDCVSAAVCLCPSQVRRLHMCEC